jgi:hypothetical protein
MLSIFFQNAILTPMMQLTVLSKSSFKIVKPFVESDKVFRVEKEMICYQPRTMMTVPHYNETLISLPSNLINIIFGFHFNQSVDHLPISLQSISFGFLFNQPVNHLPCHLLKLSFGYSFNQSVDHLPSFITDVSFGCCFGQSVNLLPHSVLHISFKDKYNPDVYNIRYIIDVLNEYCSRTENGYFTDSRLFALKYINEKSQQYLQIRSLFGENCFNQLMKKVTPSLYQRFMSCYIHNKSVSNQDHIVDQLKLFSIHLDAHCLNVYFDRKVDSLPPFLKTLSFNNKFNQPVDYLPHYLLRLSFGKCFNQSINHLPQCIQNLSFGDDFNQTVICLPSSVKCISFGRCFNQNVDYLPHNLYHISFGDHFNQSVNLLPPNLRRLYLGEDFNQPLDNLPTHLEIIFISRAFNLSLKDLPENMHYVCSDSYKKNFPMHYWRKHNVKPKNCQFCDKQ